MKKLFEKLKARFTKWYIRKGYDVDYDFDTKRVVWKCPFWVKPLLIFFDTGVYFQDAFKKAFRSGIEKSLNRRNRKADKFQ